MRLVLITGVTYTIRLVLEKESRKNTFYLSKVDSSQSLPPPLFFFLSVSRVRVYKNIKFRIKLHSILNDPFYARAVISWQFELCTFSGSTREVDWILCHISTKFTNYTLVYSRKRIVISYSAHGVKSISKNPT